MRKILFRGKRLDNGEWIYGGYQFEHGFGNPSHCILEYSTFGALTVNNIIKVYSDTVGQFTGLLDKNGNKIFEGDIVDIHQTVNGQNLFIVTMDKGFINVKYALIDRNYEYDIKELLDFYKQDKEIEVIGNINEDKELLK